ncbi:MAG: hypothetical protein LBC52_06860 [Treponema sp.]|jgi:hypothetical protein|nr:hypothetical protein [Treponema sp.]
MANIFNRETIIKEKLILAEGDDDCYFLYYLLPIKGIDDIQISDIKGVDKLTEHIKAIKGMDGFDNVTSILIIRDSEKSTESACKSVNNSLRKTELIEKDIEPFIMSRQNNRKIGFALFPGIDENGKIYKSGALEDLCLRLFKDKSVNEKVKAYIKDFQLNTENFKKPHKNELHASFSFTDNFVGLKIGETAKAGGFDFDSPHLEPFLKMIKEM